MLGEIAEVLDEAEGSPANHKASFSISEVGQEYASSRTKRRK